MDGIAEAPLAAGSPFGLASGQENGGGRSIYSLYPTPDTPLFGSGCVPLPSTTAATVADPLPPLLLLMVSCIATSFSLSRMEMGTASGSWSPNASPSLVGPYNYSHNSVNSSFIKLVQLSSRCIQPR